MRVFLLLKSISLGRNLATWLYVYFAKLTLRTMTVSAKKKIRILSMSKKHETHFSFSNKSPQTDSRRSSFPLDPSLIMVEYNLNINFKFPYQEAGCEQT